MNYGEQQRFLSRSRMRGAASLVILSSLGAACWKTSGRDSNSTLIAIGITAIALAGSTYYTPGYLQLSVKPLKKSLWETRIRWRVIPAVFLIGMFGAASWGGRVAVLLAVAWLVSANLAAKAAVAPRCFPAYFWATDFILLAAVALRMHCSLLLLTVLLAAAAHLSILVCERFPFAWAAFTGIPGCLLIVLLPARLGALNVRVWCAVSFLASAVATAWLVDRAQRHNRGNISTAMKELVDFRGYSPELIMQMWSVSDQELAKNWQLAGLDENNGDRMAQWYRENSELYMFAISAYNLEYKRIRSNLRSLKFARGSCLDYGAGNGELILELARRGHSATYYDVEGQTMRFARSRAQRESLAAEFLHSKKDLEAAARRHGFDTIFSFDVLEHLPDLPGELDFLASLLNPSGRLIFDVPAGSTRSHPMHLNHRLDVRAHLRTKGLEEEHSLALAAPFSKPFGKQEKYIFRAPA